MSAKPCRGSRMSTEGMFPSADFTRPTSDSIVATFDASAGY